MIDKTEVPKGVVLHVANKAITAYKSISFFKDRWDPQTSLYCTEMLADINALPCILTRFGREYHSINGKRIQGKKIPQFFAVSRTPIDNTDNTLCVECVIPKNSHYYIKDDTIYAEQVLLSPNIIGIVSDDVYKGIKVWIPVVRKVEFVPATVKIAKHPMLKLAALLFIIFQYVVDNIEFLFLTFLFFTFIYSYSFFLVGNETLYCLLFITIMTIIRCVFAKKVNDTTIRTLDGDTYCISNLKDFFIPEYAYLQIRKDDTSCKIIKCFNVR